MRRVLLLVTVAAVMVALMLVSALPAFAHGTVRPHQHFLQTPEESKVGEVEVGPRVCPADVPQAMEGFHKFHENVHVSDNPTTVVGRSC